LRGRETPKLLQKRSPAEVGASLPSVRVVKDPPEEVVQAHLDLVRDDDDVPVALAALRRPGIVSESGVTSRPSFLTPHGDGPRGVVGFLDGG